MIPLGVGRNHQRDDPVGVDVVRAVLGVVLDDENGRLLPELAFAQRLDNHAQGQVVVGHHRGRGRRTDPGAGGVVVAESQDRQLREVAFLFEPLDFLDEMLGPFDVGIFQVVAAELGVKMAFEGLHGRLAVVVGAVLVLFAVGNPLAVGAIGHAGLGGAVPDVVAARPGDVIHRPLGGIGEAFARRTAIAHRPGLFNEVGGIGAHRPFVTVGRHLALDVQVVEQHKLFHELVVVRRDRLGEEAEFLFAIALGHVAEHLIVGSVFLHDVNAMLDRGLVAQLLGDRVVGRHAGAVRNLVLRHRTAGVSGLGVLGHFRGGRHVDDADGPLEQVADVFTQVAGRDDRVRPVAVALGNQALSIGNVDLFVNAVEPHGSRVPARGNEAHRHGLGRVGDIEDADVVGVGIGDQQHRPLGNEREAVGRVAARAGRIQGARDRLQRFERVQVQDAHLR